MELIKKYFTELTEDQLNKLEALETLYADWNAKINVISRKNMDQFYCNHVLHSLAIAKLYEFAPDENIMDIGTGGGFPGVPLAIFFPQANFTLVDSIRKKTTVILAVKDALNLDNITVINDRMENINGSFDTIISRAVAPASKLVHLTKDSLKSKGSHIFIKGGDLTREKREVLKKYKSLRWYEHDLNSHFEESFFETKKVISLQRTT